MQSQCLIGGIQSQPLFNQAKHAAKGFRLAAHEQLTLAWASMKGQGDLHFGCDDHQEWVMAVLLVKR
jgi:hypothetical protein